MLRRDAVGGGLLLASTYLALAWANGPWSSTYSDLQEVIVGPGALDLDLTLSSWASEGLLAVFFFLAGIELKHELVVGSLRDRRTAIVPAAAAVGGVVVPALIYLFVVLAGGSDETGGWAIPAATDIAFALAVLAVIGRGLPAAVRAFLLTTAVVDDLLAIVIIAVGYTHGLELVWLMLSLVPLTLFGVLARQRKTRTWVVVPLAITAWALVHASGVHATVAGLALGLLVPADDLGRRIAHQLTPWSAGLAVPVFALFAAGVDVRRVDGFPDTVALAVILGLVVGKPLGIAGTAWLTTRLTSARLDPTLVWADIAAAGMLGGIGFTVSLLVSELAVETSATETGSAKLAVLCGSTVAAALGAVLLHHRGRRHRGVGRDVLRR